MTLWNWLEGVKPGLGVYLHVFEKYGADALDDLEHLDETEITKILEEIQIENKDLLPLVVRKLGSACRARMAAGAAAAAAAATAAMFTPPPRRVRGPKGGRHSHQTRRSSRRIRSANPPRLRSRDTVAALRQAH